MKPSQQIRGVLAGGLTALALLATGCDVGVRSDEGPAAPPGPAGTAAPAATGDAAGAQPAPAVLDQAGDTGSYDCGGRSVTVTGAGSRVHLRGTCGTVEVTGSASAVTVDAADRIVVSGVGARVVYGRGSTGAEPRVDIRAPGASAVRGAGTQAGAPAGAPAPGATTGAPAGAGEPIVVTEDRANVACGGRSVVVAVSNARSMDLLDCREVEISGDGNTVDVRGGTVLVRVTGRDNTVDLATSARPRVEDTGTGNDIRGG